jgi:hypothetical protein
MKKRVVNVFIFFFLSLLSITAKAQCAMCRASVENSISADSESFGASLNTGILYLFVIPYLLVALIAFLWYRGSHKNEKHFKISIHSGRKMS